MHQDQPGPFCPACGAGSTRAVRTRCVHVGNDSIYYLTYVWACRTCDRQWLDDSLERLNNWAADAARQGAAVSDAAISPASVGRFGL
jgi:hypothetical protein